MAIGRKRFGWRGSPAPPVGLLNGFTSCGPLQTMQLYALGTGSFIAGAGPSFSSGLAGASFSGTAAPAVQKVQAASVQSSAKKNPASAVENGKQTIVTEIGSRSYVPFSVQAGVPLTWIARVSAANLKVCNNAIIVPAYGIEKKLMPGDGIIEFTPKASGTIPYCCRKRAGDLASGFCFAPAAAE